jgi:hypothetical protein
MMPKVLVSLFFIFSLIACMPSPPPPLSKEERKLRDQLGDEYRCDVSMRHDENAVAGYISDSIFYVYFKDTDAGYCSQDTFYLKKVATEIATKIIPVLSYRSSYKLIHINFYKVNYSGKDNCDKEFEVEVKYPDKVSYIHREYNDPPARRSSEIIER